MPEPSDLKDFRRHAEWALVAATALERGLLDALAEEPDDAAGLADRLDLDARATRIVLGVLEEMGLVRSEPGGVRRVTGEARGALIDPDTPDYRRDAVLHWLSHLRDWAESLPATLRTGEPPADEETVDEEEALERFQAAMAAKSPELVEAVIDEAARRAPGGGRALDLGGGPGTFSRELLDRGREVVLMDTPEVIDHVADDYGLAGLEGLELVSGDFHEELPDGPFQLVLMANITHIFDDATNERLVRRVGERIAPGGVLAVLDFVRGVEPFSALFAVTMLMHTERGDTHPLPRYEAWMEAAGLEEVRCRGVPEERQVVTAVRPRRRGPDGDR